MNFGTTQSKRYIHFVILPLSQKGYVGIVTSCPVYCCNEGPHRTVRDMTRRPIVYTVFTVIIFLIIIIIFFEGGGGQLDINRLIYEYSYRRKAKSLPAAANIEFQATIGPPTKRHSNGVSLVGRYSPAVICLLGYGRVQCKLTSRASCKLAREHYCYN